MQQLMTTTVQITYAAKRDPSILGLSIPQIILL